MIHKPPLHATKSDKRSVFLAGSIELGKAELWQPRLGKIFDEAGYDVYDPRRDNWDWSTPMDPTPGSVFEQQVSWEQDHIDKADLVFFKICGGETMAIVSMFEMGAVLAQRKPVVILADKDYMRRANIEVTAKRYGVGVFEDEAEAVQEALKILKKI